MDDGCQVSMQLACISPGTTFDLFQTFYFLLIIYCGWTCSTLLLYGPDRSQFKVGCSKLKLLDFPWSKSPNTSYLSVSTACQNYFPVGTQFPKFKWYGFAWETRASVLILSSWYLPCSIFLQHWCLWSHSVYKMLSVWNCYAQFFFSPLVSKNWKLSMYGFYICKIWCLENTKGLTGTGHFSLWWERHNEMEF